MSGSAIIKSVSPLVGTGMEGEMATAMGWTVRALHDGTVSAVDADKIVLKLEKTRQN